MGGVYQSCTNMNTSHTHTHTHKHGGEAAVSDCFSLVTPPHPV